MYDLPKKEDALLYQSKGKAELGWGGHPATFIPLPQGPWCQGEPEISIPIILSSPRGEKPCHRPINGIHIRAIGPGGGTLLSSLLSLSPFLKAIVMTTMRRVT